MRRLLLFAVLLTGCPAPAPEQPIPIRAAELVKAYREDAKTASKAYDGRPVLLGLTFPVRVGDELHWHLSDQQFPALIICRFDGEPPPVARVVWITGTCRGHVIDGKRHEFRDIGFHIVIAGCRPASAPTPGQ